MAASSSTKIKAASTDAADTDTAVPDTAAILAKAQEDNPSAEDVTVSVVSGSVFVAVLF